MWKCLGLVLLSSSTLLGCVANVGSSVHVPENAATSCSEQCADIGLTMTAVAIMANNVGCVCQSRQATASVSTQSAATAGGMATIMMQQQAQQQQQQAAQ